MAATAGSFLSAPYIISWYARIAPVPSWTSCTTPLISIEVAGKINAGDAKWIGNKLDIAQKHYQKGLNTAADNQMEQILRRLDAMVESGDAREADVAALRSLVTRIMNASS